VQNRQIHNEDEDPEVKLRWGVAIPLRDGVHLNATLYLPASHAPAPCIVTLTPYIADSYHERGVYFAREGLPFLAVDVRGRGNSEGVFQPMLQEANDGYDVIEWVAQQPYCNGKVAMWGGSYAGYNQWATAKEFPPHLATIAPAAAPFFGVDFPMRSNILYPYLLQWITYTRGRALQAQIFADQGFWSHAYKRWYISGRPFRELDSLLGLASEHFQEWLTHPEPDAYWDAYNPTAEQYARLAIPILTITGSYDDDQPGALQHYRQHLGRASSEAGRRHYLIIGPWDHAGTRTPKPEFGGVQFGPASLLNLSKLHREWYAWTMQGEKRPEFLQRQVAYYVMGAERWRYADTLDQATSHHLTWFLESTSNASDPLSAGSLGPQVGTGSPDSYRFDPAASDGPELEAEARVSAASLVDQTVHLALRGRVLVYHTAPLTDDLEVTGFFTLSAWIAIDTPDTDFYVSVHEIDPEGRSIRLTTDALRARYREGLRVAKLIDTSEPLEYEFERFTFVSRRIRRGCRLRLVIAPIGRVIDATFTQKNYNSGGIVAEEGAEGARAVTVRLYHDPGHPSALRVPIGRPEGADEPQAPTAYFA